MQNSSSIINLVGALRKAKLAFAPLVKNQENPGFKRGNKVSKYADLGAVLEATESHLEAHGLLLTQFPVSQEARVGVRTLLVHESGEYLMDEFYLSLGKTDAQAGAGAVTYARRVAMKAILGLTDEDDDGNTASRKEESAAEPVETKTKATKQTAKAAPATEAKTTVAKAEIPTDSGALPNEPDMKKFRTQFVRLVDSLEEAGVAASKGNPVQKQVLAYLLKTTGASKPEDITKAGWQAFFAVTDASLATKESAAALVEQVNLANVKQEKKS